STSLTMMRLPRSNWNSLQIARRLMVISMSHNAASEMCALETWAYPVEKPLALIRESWQLDAAGLPTRLDGSACHPETIALYALEQWQDHLAHQDETFGQTFLALTRWFVQHETLITQANSENNP